MSMLAEVPGISPETRRCLEGGGMYTVLDFYNRTTVEIVESADVPSEAVDESRAALARHLAPPATTVIRERG